MCISVLWILLQKTPTLPAHALSHTQTVGVTDQLQFVHSDVWHYTQQSLRRPSGRIWWKDCVVERDTWKDRYATTSTEGQIERWRVPEQQVEMIHQYCMYVYQRGIIYIRKYMFTFTFVFMYFRVCACSNKQFYKNSCYFLYVFKRGVNIVMCIHVIDWTIKKITRLPRPASPGCFGTILPDYHWSFSLWALSFSRSRTFSLTYPPYQMHTSSHFFPPPWEGWSHCRPPYLMYTTRCAHQRFCDCLRQSTSPWRFPNEFSGNIRGTYEGPVEKYLECEIARDMFAGTTTLSKKHYAGEILWSHGFWDIPPRNTPTKPNTHLSKDDCDPNPKPVWEFYRRYCSFLGGLDYLVIISLPDLAREEINFSESLALN